MTDNITIFLAILAGLVSFLSPCVLPLIPGFLGYLAGSSLDTNNIKRKEVFLNSVFFVLGFGLVFALLGVLLNTLLERIAYDVQIWLSRAGGVVIIFFGLYLVGLIKLKFLEKEKRLTVKRKFSSRYLTSTVFGAAFAVGWSPCVGAVLGGILGLAASQPGAAFSLLLAYSIGFGIPFLLIGLFATQAQRVIVRLGKVTKYVNILFGLILIVLGVLVFTQNLNRLSDFEFLNTLLLE